jgi:hypothetical protein
MKWCLLLALILIPYVQADELTQAVMDATSGLSQIMPGPNDFIPCNDPPVPNSLNEVNSVRTENQRGCEPLSPGKHRLMTREDGFQSGNYLLRNLGGGRFAAVLNIKWKAGNGVTPEMLASMKARTINCLRDLAPYMRNGNEKLEIQLVEPGEEWNSQTKSD